MTRSGAIFFLIRCALRAFVELHWLSEASCSSLDTIDLPLIHFHENFILVQFRQIFHQKFTFTKVF